MLRKGILVFLLLIISFNLNVVLADDDSLNLVTSPLPVNLITEPGQEVSTQLKIKNGGTKLEELEINIMKFSAFGEEGKPMLKEREIGDDYFDWVSFSEKEFVINPGEWKTITATFKVPSNAAFGYYYAFIFQRKNNSIADGEKSTKVIGATSGLVLLEVRVPEAKREIEVLEFSTPKKIYEFLPVKFIVKLKNKGNVHVSPKGNIFIDRGNEKDVAILNVNDLKGNILPDSNRFFDSNWNQGFPVYDSQIKDGKVVTDSHGKEITKLKWDWSKLTDFRWGKYTANLLLAYDDGQKDVPIEASLTFWVVPWRILGTVLLVAIILMMGVTSFLRSVAVTMKKKTSNYDKK